MAATIETTGQLRKFLAGMLVGIKDGDIKVDEARAMVKMAEKINESFYAELKIAQINLQLQRKVEALGKVKVSE